MRMLHTIAAALFILTTACALAPPITLADPDQQQITATPGPISLAPPTEQPPDVILPPTVTPDAPPPPTTAANLIGPDEYPPGVNPLTGQPVPDPAVLQRRPIVAKISNAPPLVRPQAGVGTADLVFEHYAEGGLTRFSAVFYTAAPDRVGSVRSARLVDYELAAMYQAILAFSGGSTGVEERIFGSEALGIVEARQAAGQPVLGPSDFADRAYKGVIYGPPYYFRDEAVPVPHNLFTNPNALWQLATADGVNTPPTLQGMSFSPEPPPNPSGAANLVDVRYRATRAQWYYDAERGVYLRTSDGQPHYDSLTEQQVAAENVVVIYANHRFTDIVESEWQGSKSYSIEVQLWFEGQATLARDGVWYDARWQRPTRESLMSLTTQDGTPLPLKPGKTWFQLVRLPEQQESASEWVRIE